MKKPQQALTNPASSEQATGASPASFESRFAKASQRRVAQVKKLLARKKGKPDDADLAKIDSWLTAGEQEVEARLSSRPHIRYPAELPVSERIEDIREALNSHQVVIIAGETGSGKTTQIPKICLEAGRGTRGIIGHTQPRRLAARTVASRIADEMGEPPGKHVGYQVRFTDTTSSESLVKLMTDGILLAETQHDRFLDRYDTLIIDEAHERSLNIDFLLGYLRNLLPRRPDLKVVITSATIEVDRFSRFFNNAPVIEVSGRTYPVDVRYRPLVGEDDDKDQGWPDGVINALDEIEQHERQNSQHPGDVLVFLPGEREIREMSKVLRHAELRHTEVVPLYSRLSNQEQNRIFQSHAGRRIVLSTNVAETSLTVPGIRYVVDTGVARISRYSVRSKIQRLPVEAISQASANQRKGRCGRVAPGICFRLYDESDFISRPEFTDPEILRTNLASVILQMSVSGLGDIKDFPFLDAPDSRLINDGYKLLEELGAVSTKRKVSRLGRTMAKLPVDPRLARMLVAGAEQGSLEEVLIIIAGLSIQDPRERPQDKQQAADQAHAPFNDKESDFATLVNIWRFYEEQRQEVSQNQLKRVCQKSFLSYMRMREWRDVHRQLALVCREQSLQLNTAPANYEKVHCAILSGLLGQVALKYEKREYLATRNRKVMLFPGSKAARIAPKWIVAAEIVETSRVFARTIAKIEPEWIEPLASHVLKRHYFEPHWERKRAQVVGYEKISLYGLDIVPRRRIGYAAVDPVESRQIFIRRALVEGEYDTRAPFIRHNQAALDSVEDLERKTRRRDLLVDEDTLFDFYDQRIPDSVVSGQHFETWWKALSATDVKALELTEEDIFQRAPEADTHQAYPDELAWEGVRYPLSYQFEPTVNDDGVTLQVPLMALKQVPANRVDWVVPGLLREKCVHLIKGLPKAIRRNFVPVPDYVDRALANMVPSNEPLTVILAEQLRRDTGVRIDPDAWSQEALPSHLRMNIRVVDDGGNALAEGRDVGELQAKLEARAEAALTDAPDSSGGEMKDISSREWAFGTIPETVETERGGMQVRVYPALEDQGGEVRLTRFLDPLTSRSASARGVARLIVNRFGSTLDGIERKLPEFKSAALLFAPLGKASQLRDDLLIAAVIDHFLVDEIPRNADQFERVFDAHRGDFIPFLEARSRLLYAILKTYNQLMKSLKGKIPLSLANSMADVKFQLGNLIFPGFLVETPAEWLSELPRYLEAVSVRLEKMPREAGREREFLHQFDGFWGRYAQRMEALRKQGRTDPELVVYRWMLEEFRVSFFAQQLGTSMPVSIQRINKQWENVRT